MLTLAQKTLGTAFTADARQAWATVYGLLATTMKRAAHEALAA
jgi:hypothetical protein